jgi:hypothetical protein
MKIRYTGGRSHYKVVFERKSYNFTPENNRTLEIDDRRVINYIFSLDNRVEFEVVANEPTPQSTKEEKPKKRGRPKKEESNEGK